MTRGANALGVAVIQIKERVITAGQSCGQPCSRRVARGAGGWPSRRRVVRIRGSGVVLGVAGVAIRRGSCKHVVDVAQGASHSGMRARQRERRVVVIEGRAKPVGGGVTRVARGREAGRLVIRIRRGVVIRHVAVGAKSLRRREVVVIVHVA